MLACFHFNLELVKQDGYHYLWHSEGVYSTFIAWLPMYLCMYVQNNKIFVIYTIQSTEISGTCTEYYELRTYNIHTWNNNKIIQHTIKNNV